MKIGLGIGIPSRLATISGGGSPAFSPSDISGLQLWMESSEGVTADGSNNVTTWVDRSTNVHSYDGTGHEPIIVAGVLNGEPAIRFRGATEEDYLDLASNIIAGSSSRTIFIVSLSNSDTSTNHIFSDGDGTVNGGQFSITPEYAVRVQGGNTIFSTANTSTAAILTIQQNGTNATDITGRENGAEISVSSEVSQAISVGANISAIGARYDAAPAINNYFNGDIFAILAYDSALSVADIEQVEGYLSTKYGITLA